VSDLNDEIVYTVLIQHCDRLIFPPNFHPVKARRDTMVCYNKAESQTLSGITDKTPMWNSLDTEQCTPSCFMQATKIPLQDNFQLLLHRHCYKLKPSSPSNLNINETRYLQEKTINPPVECLHFHHMRVHISFEAFELLNLLLHGINV